MGSQREMSASQSAPTNRSALADPAPVAVPSAHADQSALTDPFIAPPSPQLLGELSQFFRLLSEPARLQLLCQLKHSSMDVAALIEATGFSQSHISRQLGQLQRAGLVSCRRDGVRLIYSADDDLVHDLCDLVQNRLRRRLEHQLLAIRAA